MAAQRASILPSLHRERADGDRSGLALTAIAVLAIALVAIMVWSLTAGASSASLGSTVADWLAGAEHGDGFERDLLIIRDIRMPRMAIGAMIGAALGLSGAVRNPLADPGLIGVSAGAALGAAAMIVMGDAVLGPAAIMLGNYAVAAVAFAGALLVTLLLYQISTRRGQTSVATMLLAGIAVAALANAMLGVLIFVADDRQLRDITFWNLGSLAGATWLKAAAIAPVIALSIGGAQFLASGLNALALGEANARYMGVRVQRLKYAAIVLVAGATGCSVAISGGIGFVGIVVPHLIRLLIGPDNRFLLPSAALGGACLLLLADAVARTVVAPAELPIGIVTAAAGAPVFLWLLLRRRALVDL